MYDSPIHIGVWLDLLRGRGIDPGPAEEYEKHLLGCSNSSILGYYFGITDPAEL